jgi:hypothetical protein
MCLRHHLPQVLVAAVQALARCRLRSSIPLLIYRLGKERESEVRRALGHALHLLTHQVFFDDAALWGRWWHDRKGDFVLPPTRPRTRPILGGERRTVATFYGVPVVSHRVIFVLDRSASMLQRSGGGSWISRYGVAKRELMGAVDGLGEGARVNVILFGTEVWQWKPLPVPVTAPTRAELEKSVEALEPEGGTYLFDALEAALTQPGVETIFLLSDGEPSGGRFVATADILREARRLNETPRATIHCIAVGRHSTLLEQLARAHGGRYVKR